MKNNHLNELRDFARRVVHEGVILLENKKNTLPLINRKVALFGRIQANYYKSGTGSGGLVNATDVPNFINAVKENPRLDINNQVLKMYEEWINDNPFNAGNGMWASEPWSQVEMPLTKNKIKELKRDDEIAVMIIGRTAGEDRDNYYGEGSYLLTLTEQKVLKNLKEVYEEVVVILNVGNIIDLNFVKELNIDSVLLAWNGGQDGARATIDILTGYITPSGKLPSTVIKDLNKYPATKTFGLNENVEYIEDIYVGYRFFETFMQEEVIYPFGYGLSYTNFEINLINSYVNETEISLTIKVTNNGVYSGKETVQLYYKAPQGLLGNPAIELVGFAKTSYLKPGQDETLSITFRIEDMARYDDSGLIEKSAYILEKGQYEIHFGTSVRDIKLALIHDIKENIITEKLEEAMAPFKPFYKIRPVLKNNKLEVEYELSPSREINYSKRIINNLPKEIKDNNRNYQLIDVLNNEITIDDFVGSLSFEDLKTIIIGEGMSSPKVTPGTASAFAGVTEELVKKGVPTLATADGPSGIRMDSGLTATSLPNGSLIASTFNQKLVSKLYELLGIEMNNYNIDILLGPGMNIQRHPLNGRNFEYFSEDPLLTGVMASAVVKGLNISGVYGALKHFAANNQETARVKANSVVSERALREIYLKPFEIAVKTVEASVIMTSYNPINGIWAASNYDLNTHILRSEWGFKGIVMTDWWASMNNDNDESSKENIKAMVRAQNDLYMVTPNALEFKNNLVDEFNKGNIEKSELQRNAKNILNFVLNSLTFRNKHNLTYQYKKQNRPWFKTNEKDLLINIEEVKTTFTNKFTKEERDYEILESKGDITYALKENRLEVYGIKEEIITNEFDNILKNINFKYNNDLPKISWDEVEVNLREVVISNTNNKTLNVTTKDSIYTFPIKVTSYGKYIINLQISSELSEIVQMPFSIYIDNVNKRTVTTNGTNGELVNATSQVIINPDNKFLSFKFHKTGITVHNIKIIKHG